MNIRGLKVGDRIEFKACTRSDYKKAVRVITSIDGGRVCVRYHGYGHFALFSCEIIRKVAA